VLECHAPDTTERRDTRPTLVAFTGLATALTVAPQSTVLPWQTLPEPSAPTRSTLARQRMRRRLRRARRAMRL
jgi:hypothetical protein